MYLLDTNVISEIRKATRGRCDAAVAAWVRSIDPEHFRLSVVSILEMEIGCLSLARKDQRQAEILRRWLDHDIKAAFSGDRLISIDAVIARRCAQLHVPDPMPSADAWLAATALCRNLILVTRNVKDFSRSGVEIFNPWNFRPE